jgi:IS1 family transposase
MSFVNYLSREKQIEIIAALCEGVGQRAVTRLTGTDRKTVARLALRVGRGCAELHDRLMVGIRVNRLELDEAWSFVGKKQKNVLRNEIFAKGDQYVFIGMAGTQKAIIGWRVGKRNADTTLEFLHDLRGRVIGQPEISTDGFLPYRNSIRDTFGDSASHGVIVKSVYRFSESSRFQNAGETWFPIRHRIPSAKPDRLALSPNRYRSLRVRDNQHRRSEIHIENRKVSFRAFVPALFQTTYLAIGLPTGRQSNLGPLVRLTAV